jgi:hypothetical protein
MNNNSRMTTGQFRGSRGSTSPGDLIPKGYRGGQIQQFTPEQMELFQNLFSQVSPDSYLSRLSQGDEELFGEMEAPALRQFNELMGGLSSRFSGMGLGGRHGSGFQNASSSAASNFSQDLQSKRQELQSQAIMDLMGISNSLLGQRPQERFLSKKQHEPSFMDKWLGLAGNVMGAAQNSGSMGGF